jgi:hypothetical protein
VNLRNLLFSGWIFFNAITTLKADIIELANFPKGIDKDIDICFSKIMAARESGMNICREKLPLTTQACPKGLKIIWETIKSCDGTFKNSKNQELALYLQGLLYHGLIFDYDAWDREAESIPEFYDCGEASGGICIYKNDHFLKLTQRFPDSEFADMAAYRIAEKSIACNECDGTEMYYLLNSIKPWINFLNIRPNSVRASAVVGIVVDKLESLKIREFEQVDTPDELLSYYNFIESVASKLSPSNKERLIAVIEETKPILTNLKNNSTAPQ